MECFEKIMEILALNAISLISNFIPHTIPIDIMHKFLVAST
jgi:hypothetical protein